MAYGQAPDRIKYANTSGTFRVSHIEKIASGHDEMSDLRPWEFTEVWRQRWDEWMQPGGHGSMADAKNEKIAWAPLTKPLSKCTVALLTTGGVHLRAQAAYEVLKKDGDWTYREIPADTVPADLTISHTHYNHIEADRDINCMLPIERLPELREQGVIGGVASTHYGLMGWVPDPRSTVRDTVPAIVANAKAQGVDIVVLTPG
jgi:D-proline reductase (dithiol) PrdB